MKKRILALTLAACLMCNMSVAAFAEELEDVQDSGSQTTLGASDMSRSTSTPSNEVTEENGVGTSEVTLKVQGTTDPGDPDDPDKPVDPPTDLLIATVPVQLPILMDLKGNITVPTTAKIINNTTDKGIMVTDIQITTDPAWTLVEWADPVRTVADNKQISFAFRGDPVLADGTTTLSVDNWKIAKNGDLPINMQVDIPKQDVEFEERVASIGFTIGWSGDDSENGGSATDTFIVKYLVTDGTLEGPSRVVIPENNSLTLPVPTSTDFTKEFDKWVDADTNLEVTSPVIITKNLNLKAVFKTKAASPQNWFTVSGNTITGLSAEYMGMVDAPTDLVMPDNMGGVKITAIADNVMAGKDMITSVVVPDGVTTIGNNAFKGCTKLVSVRLPSSVVTMGDSVFENCTKLSDVILPDSITALGASAFKNCASLKSISFGTNITTIKADTFSGCTSLESFLFKGQPTSIGDNAFLNCSALKAIVLPDGITSIGNAAFMGCAGVERVVLSEGLVTIGNNAFKGNTTLTSLKIPTKVRTIGTDAFASCTALTSIDLSWALPGDAYIKGAPWGSSTDIITYAVVEAWDNNPYLSENLHKNYTFDKTEKALSYKSTLSSDPSSISIPTSIDGIRVERIKRIEMYTSGQTVNMNKAAMYIDANCFAGKATIVNIQNTPLVTIGDSAFVGCTFGSIYGINDLTTIGNSAFKNAILPNSINLTRSKVLTTIGTSAFENATLSDTPTSSISIAVPSTVTSIGTNALKLKTFVYAIRIGGAENRISGAPWGATTQTSTAPIVEWNQPY